ncbi:DUF2306 domain-containing protein [Diaphorobacter aerolatus]|uniref:DUF2306 domain-containing protein n=2 Tax=Diaphorobacter aerolatus TaxID=1288495 RepID=A0A7H0GIK4_9BURK|nr:DUF2306 domain-containing protein [Diaphorobacter aerolatus]
MTPLIATHATFALIATLAGALALFAGRQTAPILSLHRTAGLVFVLFMIGTAGTATFLRSSNALSWHGFSLVHLLIPLTALGLARAFWHLRHQNIAGHRRLMRIVYFGACVVAGLLTLAPNRLIGRWLWHTLSAI